MLKCSKCKRLTHYECTRLPAYQIYLFTRKNYRLYICDTCVGEVPEDFTEECLEKKREHKILERKAGNEEKIERMDEYNEILTNDIELKVQELEKCNTRCTKIYNENCQHVRKIKTLEEHQEVLRVTIQDMEKMLAIKDSNTRNKHDNTKTNVEEVSIQTEGVSKPITAEGMTQTELERKKLFMNPCLKEFFMIS